MENRLRHPVDSEDGAPQFASRGASGRSAPADAGFRVLCLCAEWCGTCREYRQVFAAVGEAFPEMTFRWLDIEDEAETVGDLDVENFPTLLIGRKIKGVPYVLYFGAMLPQPGHLRHLLDVFGRQSPEESQAYAASSPGSRAWQNDADLRRLCDLT